MNRILSFGVLLFSFAMVMLGYQPSASTASTTILPTYQLPITEYRVLAIVAMVVALMLLVMAGKSNWSKLAEKWLDNRNVYPLWYIIFLGLYYISFLKGFVSVVQINSPSWIVNMVFGFGYALAIYIVYIYIKYYPKKVKK